MQRKAYSRSWSARYTLQSEINDGSRKQFSLFVGGAEMRSRPALLPERVKTTLYL